MSYYALPNSSISKLSVEPPGGMRIACTEHGDEVLLILLHNPCLYLNRCKGTKNLIDKQIILSIFASAISIIKEANDPSKQIRCPLIHFRTRNEGLKEFCRMKGDVSQQVDEEMNH